MSKDDRQDEQRDGEAGVVLVTGGSRGIGAATARLAGRRGWSVAVNYRGDEQAARAVVAEIESTGGKAVAIAADVSSEADVVRLFDSVDRTLGRLSALVNNAGVVAQAGRVDAIHTARLQRMFGINVFGSFLCVREAILRMSTRHGGSGGSIVNVGSVAARLGSAGEYVDYAASKAAIDAMTIGLAHEVATEGIRVNVVRPGLIATDIHASSGEPGRAERLQPMVPMQRIGAPQEVATAILWLMSPEASYTTGAILDVGGGR